MKMQVPQGEMLMKMSGKRLGDCDGGETKREIAKIQETARTAEAQSMAMMCSQAITGMQLSMITGPNAACKDATAKAQYCERLETQEGFRSVVARSEISPNDGLAAATAYCGKSAEDIQAKLCAEAEAKEDLTYLGESCAEAAAKIAQRECAGRKYTELMGSKYQGFCTQYAKDVMDTGEPQAESPKAESKTSKAKKKLKGIFNKD
jgi:hypothetical protein